MNSTCVICGLLFNARHFYGLCASCLSTDRLKEFDRVESAARRAHREGIKPNALALTQWLSTMSDYGGLCAFCGEYSGTVIEMVDRDRGLVYDNVVPACRACHALRKIGLDVAEEKVRLYLHTERQPHFIARNDIVHEEKTDIEPADYSF